MEFKKILVTPELAKMYLKGNTSNRRLRTAIVAYYCKQILDGNWKADTGEVIKISKSGIVLDGQHRLHAIIMAGIPIYLHICFGMEDSVFDVLDTGSKRNPSDVFSIKGIKNDNKLPAIIAFYNRLKLNRRHGLQKFDKATNSMLLNQYYENEASWQHIANRARNWYVAFFKTLAPVYLGGFYAYFKEINPLVAETFMYQLSTGLNIENQTITLLRNKILANKNEKLKMTETHKEALIIKTWNCFVTGKTLKFLKYDMEREEFPIAVSGYNSLTFQN